jgi:hypothetical protein
MPFPAIAALAPIVKAAGITAAGSLIGGAMSDRTARNSASAQRQMDIEFAKNQIQWKVADAKKAGVHPLYALGASGSYAPSNVIQGQSNTGSALGTASAQIADMYMQSATRKDDRDSRSALLASQVNAANQAANRDEAAAILTMSQNRRVQQEIDNAARPTPLYNPFYNQFTNKVEYFPNQESGLQPNEIVGTGYWGLPKLKEFQTRSHSTGRASRAATRQWLKDKANALRPTRRRHTTTRKQRRK